MEVLHDQLMELALTQDVEITLCSCRINSIYCEGSDLRDCMDYCLKRYKEICNAT